MWSAPTWRRAGIWRAHVVHRLASFKPGAIAVAGPEHAAAASVVADRIAKRIADRIAKRIAGGLQPGIFGAIPVRA